MKLYLDFDGHFEAQWGSYSNVTTPVFDRDGDPTTFSDAELESIYDIWSRVVEDFAPFNIDVTTVEPPELAPGVPETRRQRRSDANFHRWRWELDWWSSRSRIHRLVY